MRKYTEWFIILCAALGLTLGSVSVSFAATGWAEGNGEWVYYRSDRSKATDVFAKSGNSRFYLDSDDVMAESQLVEEDGNYYYVNSAGAMVSSQWRSIEDEDGGGDEPDPYRYYFQPSGKAVKKLGSSDSVKFITPSSALGQSRYVLDDQGRTLFEWIDENGEVLTGEDARESGLYYCSDNGDGRMATEWKYVTTENDEDTEREGGGYWFHFATNGKGTGDTDFKKINGCKCRFDENGATHFEWYNDPEIAPGSSAVSKFRNTEEQCWMSTGWPKVIPDEDVDPKGYEEGEMQWYHADSNGDLVTTQIKEINSQSYGFDQYGKMFHGLHKIEFEENGKTIRSTEKIGSVDRLPDEDGEGVYVYYLGDSPKEDVVKTGTAIIETNGDKYCYDFSETGSRKDAGVNDVDGDSIFIKGRGTEAEEGSKCQPVTYKDKICLANTIDKLMKNRRNIRDSDDMYHKTDSKGRIMGSGDERPNQESIKSI